MSIEIEAKIKINDHTSVQRTLKSEGARFVGRVQEDNVLFDRVDGSLRDAGCGLRVRTYSVIDGEPKAATLTFKGPRLPGELKMREELEVHVTEPDTIIQMLAALGFVARIRFEKRRETWMYDGCTVELDEVPWLGCFVEIEGPDESQVRRVQRALGLGDLKTIPESYIHLLIAHAEANRLPIDHVRFG